MTTTNASHRPASSATQPEWLLRATGAVRLVLVINLSSFVDQRDADAFRHLRGSEGWAAALRQLHPLGPFGRDDATAKIEQAAYALRIVRSRLLHNHFFPTYRLAWDSSMRERLSALSNPDLERWQRWTGRIRLTRGGLAVVTLEQALEDTPLINCTEQVLELPASGKPATTQGQWSLGLEVLRAFFDALGGKIVIHSGNTSQVIHFSGSSHSSHTLRLDRYIVYSFRAITRDGVLLAPELLKHDYAQTLAAFMEGSLVECAGVRRYPRYAASQASALLQGDSSSWDEELCLFTGESALIYYPLVGQGLAYVGGPLGLQAHAYSSYWAGIVRGVEHLVTLRAEAQQAERRTTDLLGRIPSLTAKIHGGQLVAADLELIDHLAVSLADIFDSLPELRSMAVSTNAFRADYVRRKFEALMTELRIGQTLDLVNTNVEQLDFFLSYYNDMRLQWQGQRTNTLGTLLGAIVLFLAVSSFLADTFNVLDRLHQQESWQILLWMATAGLGLLLMTTMVLRARKLFRKDHAVHRIYNR